MRRAIFLLLMMLPAAMLAEDKPPATEVELESAHNGSYGYLGISKELERPRISVEIQGYRLKEEDRARYLGFLGFSRPFDLAGGHITVAPGFSAMISDLGGRGIAGTMNLAAKYKTLSASCYLLRNYALGREEHGFFWIYPLVVEQRWSKRWGTAWVLETAHSGKETFNEYGPRLVFHDSYGSWFAGWMTSVKEVEEHHLTKHHREHIARFGRTFVIGRHE